MIASSNPFTVSIVAPAAAGPSPDGTTALAPGGQVINADGKWTFGPGTSTGGNELLLNGVHASGGYGKEYLVKNGGNLYVFTVNGFWYHWSGGANGSWGSPLAVAP